MKKYFTIALLATALSACSSLPNMTSMLPNTHTTSASGYRLASSHWSDVASIRAEANRLAGQVALGELTKVQAAQQLNRFRIQLVGRNEVDDNVYNVYLRSAVDSQRGAITSAQSKQQIEDALKGWQQRWENMSNRPSNPAFTNFLMELMRLLPLQ